MPSIAEKTEGLTVDLRASLVYTVYTPKFIQAICLLMLISRKLHVYVHIPIFYVYLACILRTRSKLGGGDQILLL